MQIPPLDAELLDRQVLDHAADGPAFIPGQLDPQAPLFHAGIPAALVLPGLLHLPGPIFQALNVFRLVFHSQIDDIHRRPPCDRINSGSL